MIAVPAGFLFIDYNLTVRQSKIIEINKKHDLEVVKEQKDKISRQIERQLLLIQELDRKLSDYSKKVTQTPTYM